MAFLVAVGAYILGGIPMGLIVARSAAGVDIREHGSGNIGTTNVLRVIGARWAVVVFILDALKGVLPVLAGGHLGLAPRQLAFAGLLAVAGHNWSPFLRFRGGKGVATSLGVLLAVSPPTAAAVAGAWGLAVLATGYASLGSMVGLSLSGPASVLFSGSRDYLWLGILLFAMTVFQHRANIDRLIHGRELAILRKKRPGGQDTTR